MEYVLTQVNIVANESRQLECTLSEYCSNEVEAIASKTEVLFEEFEEKLRKVKAEWREELSQFKISLLSKDFFVSDLFYGKRYLCFP